MTIGTKEISITLKRNKEEVQLVKDGDFSYTNKIWTKRIGNLTNNTMIIQISRMINNKDFQIILQMKDLIWSLNLTSPLIRINQLLGVMISILIGEESKDKLPTQHHQWQTKMMLLKMKTKTSEEDGSTSSKRILVQTIMDLEMTPEWISISID